VRWLNPCSQAQVFPSLLAFRPPFPSLPLPCTVPHGALLVCHKPSFMFLLLGTASRFFFVWVFLAFPVICPSSRCLHSACAMPSGCLSPLPPMMPHAWPAQACPVAHDRGAAGRLLGGPPLQPRQRRDRAPRQGGPAGPPPWATCMLSHALSSLSRSPLHTLPWQMAAMKIDGMPGPTDRNMEL